MIAISGRLGADPKAQKTKADKPMTTGFMFGQVDTRGEDEISFPLSIVAFGHQAEALLRHDKGAFLTVSGKLQAQVYNGETRFSVLADSIVSAKAAQPRGGKAKNWADQKQSADRLYGKSGE